MLIKLVKQIQVIYNFVEKYNNKMDTEEPLAHTVYNCLSHSNTIST